MSKNDKRNTPRLPPLGDEARAARERTTERRAAAAATMREQERRSARRRVMTRAGVGVAVLALVGGGVALAVGGGGGSAPDARPSGLTADGAVRFGSQDAATTVQVVEDFQCPVCGQFEAAYGDLLSGYHDSEDVAVEYRPMAFLDRASTTEYSSRALNASACVLDEAGPEAWLDFHRALYAQQPPEGGAGLSDETLTELAGSAGAGEAGSCIEDRAFGEWVESTTAAVLGEGIDSTPTVLVDGEEVQALAPGVLEQAVEEARSS